MKKAVFAGGLSVIGVVGRMLLDAPNVETVTAVSLLAGALLGGMYVVVVPLSVIAITDMMIGNTPILLFTWSAWLVIGYLGTIMQKDGSRKNWTLDITLLGVGASVFFYFWTNFGVWLIGNLYPLTAAGLMESYIMGLPFLRYALEGNLVIVPAVAIGVRWLWDHGAVTFFSHESPVAQATQK
ncbi:MAG: DUF6580 family putative transport protein [Patescibacteria group bacterium]